MYQILHMNGIPDSNIVVMMYDDIANNPSNPKPGKVFNWPGGPDVYVGTIKDYTSHTVTAANFLNILQGKDMKGIGSGKTIASDGNDNLFVFYTDHGATQLVAFPEGPYLYAKDLIAALNSMAKANHFKELVFYLEACESGSMFNNLLDPKIKIYTMTASDPTESSWACDYDGTVSAYLNDCWSKNFMLDDRAHDPGKYTLEEQYKTVLGQTTQSHCCRYGDMSFASEDIAAFIGKKKAAVAPVVVRSVKDAVDSRYVTLAVLEHKIAGANTEAEKATLRAAYGDEIRKIRRADRIFSELRSRFASKAAVQTNDVCTTGYDANPFCMSDAVEALVERCGMLDDYMMAGVKTLAGFCAAGLDSENFRAALKVVCA